ncbi:hypothetical protein [Nocardia terpenica]|uniref:HTH cro/C1-type domain-containing protein n=1 Tax=Nocardia terpenica TaxID=455432 RepID=A0A291RT21_9NOCA|nr:hypothetical protein [Nocardia terpenica]ATL70741.1 hypothetical protein CRH09_35740 [Nocardia terpenica]
MANDNLPALTIEIVEQLKGEGMSQAEIARLYGVTRQAITDVKRRSGGYSTTPREDALKHFPWKVPGSRAVPMAMQKPYRNMRDHAEYMVTNGEGMSAEKLKRLRGFYRKLHSENVVLEFDPNIPPSPGIGIGGFAYRARTPEDGDLIIRVNEHTTLTEEGRRIWTFPAVEP